MCSVCACRHSFAALDEDEHLIMASDTCRCGHPAEVHEHYRAGSDCGMCGPGVCDRFRRDPGERPLLSWLRHRLARVRGH